MLFGTRLDDSPFFSQTQLFESLFIQSECAATCNLTRIKSSVGQHSDLLVVDDGIWYHEQWLHKHMLLHNQKPQSMMHLAQKHGTRSWLVVGTRNSHSLIAWTCIVHEVAQHLYTWGICQSVGCCVIMDSHATPHLVQVATSYHPSSHLPCKQSLTVRSLLFGRYWYTRATDIDSTMTHGYNQRGSSWCTHGCNGTLIGTWAKHHVRLRWSNHLPTPWSILTSRTTLTSWYRNVLSLLPLVCLVNKRYYHMQPQSLREQVCCNTYAQHVFSTTKVGRYIRSLKLWDNMVRYSNHCCITVRAQGGWGVLFTCLASLS